MKVTFLTEDQVWGKNSLDVLKRTEVQTVVTDLIRLQSDYISTFVLSDGAPGCYYWLASPVNATVVNVVNMQGQVYQTESFRNKIASRPVLPPEETSKIKA